MKLTNEQANAILQFLARRAGYDGCRLHEINGFMCCRFIKDGVEWDCELLENSMLGSVYFYTNSYKTILESFFKNKNKVYIPSSLARHDRNENQVIHVFQQGDSLESLMVQADLENLG